MFNHRVNQINAMNYYKIQYQNQETMGRTQRRRRRKLPKTDTIHEDVFNLQKWMNLNNPNLKVIDFKDSGRGVISRRPVSAGEELVAVPLDVMVTMSVVNQSPISQIFKSPITSSQAAITLWLVYESHLGDQSGFLYYLKVLPKTFDSLMYCAEEEIDALPTWIQDVVRGRLAEAKQSFEECLMVNDYEICEHCGKTMKDIFSYEQFLWAWICVNTRCVYYEDGVQENSEKTSSIALAPFLDFFNHSNSADVEAKLDCLRGVYSLRTRKPFKKYEQIFIKYGAYSNLRLLVEYGFILSDDDQDIVQFSLEEVLKAAKCVSSRFSDVTKLKYKFITINSLNVNLSKSRDEFSWNCNGLLYILVTQDTNLANLLSNTYSSTWSERDNQFIKQIQEKMIEMKLEQLSLELNAMERVPTCSTGFNLAKDLVRLYVKILKS